MDDPTKQQRQDAFPPLAEGPIDALEDVHITVGPQVPADGKQKTTPNKLSFNLKTS